MQMCDTQLGFGGYQHDIDTFQQAIKQINALNPDFVVICGDLVNSSVEEQFSDFNKIRSGFRVPCYCAPGNHDIESTPDPKSYKENIANYRKFIGKDYYSFEHKDYTFVIVNTQLWKSPLPEETHKQDLWLTKTLNAASKKGSPVFVIAHHPIFIEEPNEKDQYYNLPLATRKELLDLFVKNGVVAYLSGHFHRTNVKNYKGIQMVTGETTSRDFHKNPLGFRCWYIYPESVTSAPILLVTPIPK